MINTIILINKSFVITAVTFSLITFSKSAVAYLGGLGGQVPRE